MSRYFIIISIVINYCTSVYHKGYAARIDFNPLAVKQFRLPADAKFVVAQSLAVKNKAASNDFNTRVVECRLASQVNVSFEKGPEPLYHLPHSIRIYISTSNSQNPYN